MVSVRVRDRPVVGVLADMIEGVVAANRLTTPQSDRLRADLWEVVESKQPTGRRARDAA